MGTQPECHCDGSSIDEALVRGSGWHQRKASRESQTPVNSFFFYIFLIFFIFYFFIREAACCSQKTTVRSARQPPSREMHACVSMGLEERK